MLYLYTTALLKQTPKMYSKILTCKVQHEILGAVQRTENNKIFRFIFSFVYNIYLTVLYKYCNFYFIICKKTRLVSRA